MSEINSLCYYSNFLSFIVGEMQMLVMIIKREERIASCVCVNRFWEGERDNSNVSSDFHIIEKRMAGVLKCNKGKVVWALRWYGNNKSLFSERER